MASVDASVNDPVTGRFVNGNPSAYRLRLARRAALRDGLLRDYDFSRHMVLLPVIADHLDAARHTRNPVDRTRSANAARRLLAGVPHRQAPEPPAKTLAQLEAMARE